MKEKLFRNNGLEGDHIERREIAGRALFGPNTQKNILDHAVVIPCYKEGFGVLKMLYSLAVQRTSRREHSAVFVVINQTDTAQEDSRASNMQTYTLMQCLRYKKKVSIVPRDGINADNACLMNKWIDAIVQSDLEINIVDMFSGEYAHRDNNVGRARSLGFDEAADHLSEGVSTLVGSDADARLGSYNFLRSVAKQFRDSPDVGSIMPYFAFEISGISESDRRAFEDEDLYDRTVNAAAVFDENTHAVMFKRGEDVKRSDEGRFFTRGSATVVTKNTHIISDGIESLPGEEDVRYGQGILTKGVGVMRTKSPDVLIMASPRTSDRTEKGFGNGQYMLEWANEPFGENHRVETVNHVVCFTGIIDDLYRLGMGTQEVDREAFVSVIKRHVGNKYTLAEQKEVDILWSAYAEYTAIKNIFENIVFIDRLTRFLSQPKFGNKVPFPQSLEDMESRAEIFSLKKIEKYESLYAELELDGMTWQAFCKKFTDVAQSIVAANVPRADISSHDMQVRIRLILVSLFAHMHHLVSYEEEELDDPFIRNTTNEHDQRYVNWLCARVRLRHHLSEWYFISMLCKVLRISEIPDSEERWKKVNGALQECGDIAKKMLDDEDLPNSIKGSIRGFCESQRYPGFEAGLYAAPPTEAQKSKK